VLPIGGLAAEILLLGRHITAREALEWVDWFNNRRLLEPIGNIPPAEFEAVYYANNKAPALMAGLT
jgi:transposase InsO family protein